MGSVRLRIQGRFDGIWITNPGNLLARNVGKCGWAAPWAVIGYPTVRRSGSFFMPKKMIETQQRLSGTPKWPPATPQSRSPIFDFRIFSILDYPSRTHPPPHHQWLKHGIRHIDTIQDQCSAAMSGRNKEGPHNHGCRSTRSPALLQQIEQLLQNQIGATESDKNKNEGPSQMEP